MTSLTMNTFFPHSCYQLQCQVEARDMHPKRGHKLTVELRKCVNSAAGNNGPERADGVFAGGCGVVRECRR